MLDVSRFDRSIVPAILAKMFRPKYPHLHCYAYCPPGCSTSTKLSLECEAYVTSIVVGNDIIPRYVIASLWYHERVFSVLNLLLVVPSKLF